MKRIVLLVAIFVFAVTLAVPAFVSVSPVPTSDASITAQHFNHIHMIVADPECPPGGSAGTGSC